MKNGADGVASTPLTSKKKKKIKGMHTCPFFMS
jgi:hypothetical protein